MRKLYPAANVYASGKAAFTSFFIGWGRRESPAFRRRFSAFFLHKKRPIR